jgi:hypothetical protein
MNNHILDGIEFGHASEYQGKTQIIVRYDHRVYKNRPHLRIFRQNGDAGWKLQRYLHDVDERIHHDTDYLTVDGGEGLSLHEAKTLAARLVKQL